MLTLTAPGDRQHHRRDGSACPCTPPGGVDLADWNPRAGERWNRLRTWLTRQGLVSYFRAVEVQKRGALHLHVLLATQGILALEAVREAAMDAGFGHSVDLACLDSGREVRAALYAAKYVTKSCDSRAEVPWLRERVDYVTGEVTDQTEATFRTWSRSASWGVSMQEIRAAIRRAAGRVEPQPAIAQSDGQQEPAVVAAPPPD
jgi:hypothetical protein